MLLRLHILNSNQEQIDMFGYTTNEAITLIEEEHNLIEQKERMLNGMVSFFSLESKHNDFQRSFVHKVREFFSDGLRRRISYSWKMTIEDIDHIDFFTNSEKIDEVSKAIAYIELYEVNKNSPHKLQILTQEIVAYLSFEELFLFLTLSDVLVEGEDWYNDCLAELYKMPEIMNRLQQFIISAINDSQRKLSVYVKKRTPNPLDLTENQLELTWYIDQEFIFSNEDYERKEGVSVLFDNGLIMNDLGFFDQKSSPPAVIEKFRNKTGCQSWGDDLDFYSWNEKEVPKVCDAWIKGDLGPVEVIRQQNKITLKWCFPDSFMPYDKKTIEYNLYDRFSEINTYQYYENHHGWIGDVDDDMYRMIINSNGY